MQWRRLTLRSSGQPPGYRVLPLTSNVRLRNTNAGSASVVINSPSRAKSSAHVSVRQGSCELGQALRRFAAFLHLVNGWRSAPACCAARSVVAFRRARAGAAPTRLASRGGPTDCEAAARAKENSSPVLPLSVHASSHGKSIFAVALAALMQRLAGVTPPVAHMASFPQSNHSVKRTAPGVPGSAAYLKR